VSRARHVGRGGRGRALLPSDRAGARYDWPVVNPPARALEIEGWMTAGELGFLYQTALAMPEHVRVVELGSWKGRSTVALCEGLKEKAPELWSVDTFRGDSFIGTVEVSDVLPEFERNVSPYPFIQTIVSDTVAASDSRTVAWIGCSSTRTTPLKA
jgi:hypothetical protein